MRTFPFPLSILLFLTLTLALACRVPAETRFVHADGKFLADADGHKLILRGTNLGNWLVQEGYMFRLEGGPQSAREIEAMVNELIGPTDAAKFWHAYRDRYITRQDIDFIAKAGFNTIRIPFHYKFFEPGNEEGFTLMDRVAGWAKEDGLHVILDMHCAPGGQTGANIDDSWGYPWLYEDEASQQHAVDIWKRVAAHWRAGAAIFFSGKRVAVGLSRRGQMFGSHNPRPLHAPLHSLLSRRLFGGGSQGRGN